MSEITDGGLVIERKNVKIKAEFEARPIRHIAIQCPHCYFWFMGVDIIQDRCEYDYQIHGARCVCPKCESEFEISYDSEIDKSNDFPEFYKKCLHKKVTWK